MWCWASLVILLVFEAWDNNHVHEGCAHPPAYVSSRVLSKTSQALAALAWFGHHHLLPANVFVKIASASMIFTHILKSNMVKLSNYNFPESNLSYFRGLLSFLRLCLACLVFSICVLGSQGPKRSKNSKTPEAIIVCYCSMLLPTSYALNRSYSQHILHWLYGLITSCSLPAPLTNNWLPLICFLIYALAMWQFDGVKHGQLNIVLKCPPQLASRMLQSRPHSSGRREWYTLMECCSLKVRPPLEERLYHRICSQTSLAMDR